MKKISVEDLKEGMFSNQTICDKRGMVLVAKGIILTKLIIQRLQNFDIGFITIKEENDEMTEICRTDTLTAQQTIAEAKSITQDINELRVINIKNNTGQIEEIIYSILERQFIQEFLAGCAQSAHLYKHSIRTAIMSINLALIKKYDRLNVEYMAMCAILHDCGMEGEFKEKDIDHPFLGFVKLRKNLDVDMVIALACLQHHEHYNGSGYPFSFMRTQIAEFSSLLAVVDHYDRLIMQEIHPRKALFETIGKKKIFFDPESVDLLGSTIDWSRLYV